MMSLRELDNWIKARELNIWIKRREAEDNRFAAKSRVEVSRAQGMTDEEIIEEAQHIFGSTKPDLVKVVKRVVTNS